VKQGRLAPEDVAPALRALGALPDRARWRRFIEAVLLWSGSLLLTAGVIFFFAYNWPSMGKVSKFLLAQGLLVVATAGSLFPRPTHPAAKASLFVAALLVGALFALFGQIYQTGADTWELFAAWALAILPFTLVSRLALFWVLFLALANLAVAMYFEIGILPFGWIDSTEPLLWALFVLDALALVVWEFAGARAFPWLQEAWGARVLGAAGAMSITVLCAWTAFGIHDASLLFAHLAYLAWLVLTYRFYRHRRFDLFMLSVEVFSLVAVLSVWFADSLSKGHTSGAWFFFLVGVQIIVCSAMGGFWLQRIAREDRS